jgi:hypothetical protein
MDLRTERGAPQSIIAMNLRTERDAPPGSADEGQDEWLTEGTDERTEGHTADEHTDDEHRAPGTRTEDDPPRSHAAFFCDLAQLSDDDYGFFCDERFTMTPNQFWSFHDAYSAGEVPKLGRYEYDGTTLYFKNMTIVHGGVASNAGMTVYQQCLGLQNDAAVG